MTELSTAARVRLEQLLSAGAVAVPCSIEFAATTALTPQDRELYHLGLVTLSRQQKRDGWYVVVSPRRQT